MESLEQKHVLKHAVCVMYIDALKHEHKLNITHVFCFFFFFLPDSSSDFGTDICVYTAS